MAAQKDFMAEDRKRAAAMLLGLKLLIQNS